MLKTPSTSPPPSFDLPDEQAAPNTELIDRLKKDAVFAASFLDDKSADELAPFKEEYADQLMISNEINDILLDPEVARFRPERVSQQIVSHCAHLLWSEPLPDETSEFLKKASEMLPDKFAAYQRDVTRLIKERVESLPTDLPQTADDDFEDPFGIGRAYLFALSKDRFNRAELKTAMIVGNGDSTQAVDELLSEFSFEEQLNILDKTTRLKRGPAEQPFIAASAIYFPQQRTHKRKDPMAFWNAELKNLPDVPFSAKTTFFMSLRSELTEKSQGKIVSRLLREYCTEAEPSSIQPLIALHQSPAGEHFTDSLQKHPALLSNIVKRSCEGSPLESAFALRVLHRYCEEVGIRSALPNVLDSYFSVIGNLGNKGAASAVNRLLGTFLEGNREAYELALQQILKSDNTIQKIPITLIRSGEPEEIRAYLREKYAVFGAFPDDVLDEALHNRLKCPREATEELYLELGEAELPSDFDQETAAIEIYERTSLPLAETRRINLNGVLGAPFQVTILPASGSDTLGAWSLNIQYTGFRGHRLVNEAVELDFRECELITEVPTDYRRLAEGIGIYCAHQFFVKQSADYGLEDPQQKPPSDRPSSQDFSLPDTDVEIAVDDECERDYQQRLEKPLTIDITTEDKKRLAERRTCVRKTLETNKGLIRKLLSEEYDEDDIADVLLHRVAPGSQPSRPMYQPVSSDDVLEAIIYNNLAERNWYFLNSLPHTKNLGYHVGQHVVEDEDDSSKSDQIPLWLVRRKQRTERSEQAYGNYRKSGFPDLSDFNDVEAWLGITADAVYEKGHSVQLKTEAGDVLASGKTARKDLNAEIALKVNSGGWMKEWLKSRKRVLAEEIEFIRGDDLSEEEKVSQISSLEAQIKELPKYVAEMMQQSGLQVGKSAACRSVRFTLAKVHTGTTFSQGNYLPISALVKKDETDS